jgi:TPR repeat protein
VAKDQAEAIRLYVLAAKQGMQDAQASLRRLGKIW